MRLTNAMRDSVIEEEMILKFNQPIKDAQQAIITQLENEVKDKYCQEYVPQKMIDDGWVKTSCDVSVKYPGDKYNKSYSMGKSFPIKAHASFDLQASEKLMELNKEKTSLEVEKSKFKSNMRQIMYSFTTVRQIKENLPELASYFQDEVKAMSMALVPAEQIFNFRKQLSKYDITKKEKTDGQEKVLNSTPGQLDSKVRGRKVAS